MAAELADALYLAANAEAARSFSDLEVVQRAICETGATHVYPGYGFSSERGDLARAVIAAGASFIGPSPALLDQLGDKERAAAFAREAGLPTLTIEGEISPDAFPVLLKARAGGGGRGNVLVEREGDLEAARAALRARAGALFGDAGVFVERFVQGGRHVEVQFFGFGERGAAVLGTRDCSLQRRQQKVIEEGPASPGVRPLLAAHTEAIQSAIKSLGYRGAGTLELLWDRARDELYFLEINARIQVEHPVTEELLGEDLVEWQLREAFGMDGANPVREIARAAPGAGHAIEARIYAEDPAAGFVPDTGRIHALHAPRAPFVRWDASVRAGDTITEHYDPMIAKLIVRGATRAQAWERLARALDETHVHGVTTNLGLLSALARDAVVRRDEHDTGYLERERVGLEAPVDAPEALLADAREVLEIVHEARPRESGRDHARGNAWREGHRR